MAPIMWAIFFLAIFGSVSANAEGISEIVRSELEALKHRLDEQDNVLENMKINKDQVIQNLENRVVKLEAKVDKQNEIIEELKLQAKKTEDNNSPIFKIKQPQPSPTNVSLEERVEYLEEVTKIKVLKTCEEMRLHGVTKSGYFHIDPDGDQCGHPPIRAWCDFEANVTEILHDSDNILVNIHQCTEEHCYRKDYIYTSPLEQIASLISLSDECTQEITFDCLLAPLSLNGVQIGSWLDRYGDPQVYFSGSNYGEHMCSCHSNNTCVDEDIFDTKCNCDSNLPKWLEDSGRIDNKTALPISAFIYGPLEYEMQQAKVKVGRLRCSGKTQISSPPTSCSDLKKMGETRPGYYPIHHEESNSPELAYCEMTEPGYDGDMQTDMGWMKLTTVPGQLVFAVQQSASTWNTAGTIPFDVEVTNKGGAMNLGTGTFTAPVDGLYEFKFSTNQNLSHNLNVVIYVNNNLYSEILSAGGSWYDSVSRIWVLDLMKDDTVHLHLEYGSLRGIYHDVEFSGKLI